MSDKSEYLVRDSCPFCGHAASVATPVMSSPVRAEDLGFSEQQVLYRSHADKPSFFTYYRCPACAGLFCRIYFTPEQLQDVYAHQYENMAAVPMSCRARTQEAYFRILQRYSALTGQMLELGPDIGLFTRCCVARGHYEKYWLYEPNVEVHETLRQNLGAIDFFLTTRSYSAADVPAQSLSTAVLIHVLDHILALETLLNDLSRSLRPGATLFLVTHDEASLLARLLGWRWPPYALWHPQLFSAASMKQLLHRHGFEVVKVVKCVNYLPTGYLAKMALAVIGLTVASQTTGNTPSIGIKLGNIATIARRI